jgi:Amt family ammonium transporter
MAYAAAVTFILVWLVDKLFKFRSSPEKEMQGLDYSYHGEHGYGMMNPS